MPPLSRDTRQDAEDVQFDLLRQASPARKFALSQAMTSHALQLQRRALAELHPDADDRELRLLALELNHGSDLARRVRAFLAAREA